MRRLNALLLLLLIIAIVAFYSFAEEKAKDADVMLHFNKDPGSLLQVEESEWDIRSSERSSALSSHVNLNA
ncbi:hypothetical protein GPALN_005754 [Globodera pallida]|nr:hypothetical protein GPALN_005754 [Globodera pallida]